MWMASATKEGTMKKPTTVSILGVEIPLDTIQYTTSTPPAIHAVIGEWNNYYSEMSEDIAKAIDEFEALPIQLRPAILTEPGKQCQFFTYSTLTPKDAWDNVLNFSSEARPETIEWSDGFRS